MFNLGTVDPVFEKVLVTFGELTTTAFRKEDRNDDTFVVHGEGYTFYIWYKEEANKYYKSGEYKQLVKQDDPDLKFKSQKELIARIMALQDVLKVFFIEHHEIIDGDISLPPPEPVGNGIIFRIAKKDEQIDIDFPVLQDRYVKKCDLLFESLFRLIEDLFSVKILNKEEVKVFDHLEDGKEYCAANFYLDKTSQIEYNLRNKEEIPLMSEIAFQKHILDVPQKEYGIDIKMPIKNLKVYFEKTSIADINNHPIVKASKDHHMYFTMNFHLFFWTEYGERAKVEEARIEKIVDEIEKVYCMNFKCEPDLDTQTELNFFKVNRHINPEHFMVVNYFKPSLVYEHFLLSKEDKKELDEEVEDLNNAKDRMLEGGDVGLVSKRLLVV